MEVRLDKWLSVAQVFKTRTQATQACSLGRVRVNGVTAKPHRILAVDDCVEFEQKGRPRKLIVRELREKSLPRAEAKRLYEDQSPEQPKLDQVDRILKQPTVRRDRGKGRPTKKERRRLQRSLEDDSRSIPE